MMHSLQFNWIGLNWIEWRRKVKCKLWIKFDLFATIEWIFILHFSFSIYCFVDWFWQFFPSWCQALLFCKLTHTHSEDFVIHQTSDSTQVQVFVASGWNLYMPMYMWYACMEWCSIWLCNTIRFCMQCCIFSTAVLSYPNTCEAVTMCCCCWKIHFCYRVLTHSITGWLTVLHCTYLYWYISLSLFIVMHCLYKKNRMKRKPKFTKNWKYTHERQCQRTRIFFSVCFLFSSPSLVKMMR